MTQKQKTPRVPGGRLAVIGVCMAFAGPFSVLTFAPKSPPITRVTCNYGENVDMPTSRSPMFASKNISSAEARDLFKPGKLSPACSVEVCTTNKEPLNPPKVISCTPATEQNLAAAEKKQADYESHPLNGILGGILIYGGLIDGLILGLIGTRRFKQVSRGTAR